MMMHDYVIVGSGLFGAVFAQQAVESGKSVLLLEKRNHIGGNCFSYKHEDTGIDVHAYGTHIFHTSAPKVWEYVNRFTEFNRYRHRVLTTYQNKVFSMPINLGTINAFFGVMMRPVEAQAFLESKREKIDNPRNLEEKAISLIGRDLYDAFIKGYTLKQWGCDPRDLPANIITRLPIRTSFDDAYFDDVYQGIPVDGYTPMFERMLKGIPVETGVDFFEDRGRWMSQSRKIVYTGPIDRYFDYVHGRLNWRSVRFETDRLEIDDYQGTAVMNYAETNVPYTRIHEPKHLHLERPWNRKDTVVIREFSQTDDEAPYYPVNFDSDRELFAKYEVLAGLETHVIFGGRLARYKYYDMHQVIGNALVAAKRELSGIEDASA